MSRQQKRAIERRKSKNRYKRVGQTVALSVALAAANVLAAEAEKKEEFTLPPVVVREQGGYYVPQSSLSKIPEPLKDVPQSITIIPQQLMEEQGVTSFREALRNVPGIGITAGEGGGAQGDNLTLRGFNARNDMFIDGVRDQGSYFRDVFNIESIEVLKGPSAFYFGRGSTGGGINQVSKAPRLDPSYSGTFSGGSGLLLRGAADINQPIFNTSAVRLNLMAHKDNLVDREVVDMKRLGVAPSIAFGLGTPTQVTLSYLFQKEDNTPDYGFPFAAGAPARARRNNFYGLADDDYERTWLNVGTLRLDHRFNDQLSLRNTSRFSHTDREAAPTIPGFTAPGTATRNHVERDTQESILSNQTDLTAKFDTVGLKHTFVTGVEIGRETFNSVRHNYDGEPSTDLGNPNHNDNLAGTIRSLALKADTTSVGFGIFAADQIKLNQYFDILGGVRWDYFDTHNNEDFPNNITRERTDREWSYRGGLIFHPTPAQSYYFSYATSFNPSAEALSLANNNTGTSPEKNRTFEVGGKVELRNGALSLQGALFRIDKTDARVNDPVTGLQVLEGKQRVNGVEFGIAGRLQPGWNLFAGYTFLDSEFVKSTDPAVEGKDLQNVPEHSATLWTTYDFLERWQVGGGPTYVGRRYANAQNTNRVSGYVRWDATLAYQVSERIHLRVNALNVTDKFYFQSVHPSHVIPGGGRAFIFSTDFSF